MAVIGSVLISPETIKVIDQAALRDTDFSDKDARLAFRAIQDLRDAGAAFGDPVIVESQMQKIMPGEYISFLAMSMQELPTAQNIEEYCRIVREKAARATIAQAFAEAEYAVSFGDWRQAVEDMRRVFDEVGETDTALLHGNRLADRFLDYFNNTRKDESFAYCRTHIPDLDRQLGGGMFRGEMYVIGARPGMGKTTLAINIAQNIANYGKAVLFVSLEMTAPQIQAKRIALMTGLPYTDLMTGRVKEDEAETVEAFLSYEEQSKFYLTDKPRLTVNDIARLARQVPELECIIIDYIGLLGVSEDSTKKPRYEQMTEISGSIKALAKTLSVPILALSQLNRENATRSDKRPSMSDLRDSGAIEQDAGAIILLHRPDYYNTDPNEPRPPVEFIELNVAKNRHAVPGLVTMCWDGSSGRISMLEKKHEDPTFTDLDEQEEIPF